jgi:hypothetical protein
MFFTRKNEVRNQGVDNFLLKIKTRYRNIMPSVDSAPCSHSLPCTMFSHAQAMASRRIVCYYKHRRHLHRVNFQFQPYYHHQCICSRRRDYCRSIDCRLIYIVWRPLTIEFVSFDSLYDWHYFAFYCHSSMPLCDNVVAECSMIYGYWMSSYCMWTMKFYDYASSSLPYYR